MTKISEVTLDILNKFQTEISVVRGKNYLEESAQAFMDLLYARFSESIVLTRLFATVPYGKLPEKNRQFVDNLANTTGITSLINDNTLVLSLLGSRGQEPEWNDRRKSEGHVGIPLASADFIDAIPMMSRLLKELGLDLNWIASGDTKIVAKAIGKIAGIFHVPDAGSIKYAQGRNIIAAQDFVGKYNVETVFGIGGGYQNSPDNTFLTNIIFNRESIEKETAELFVYLINAFKLRTSNLQRDGNIFIA